LPVLRDTVRREPDLPDIVTFAEHPSFVGDGGPGLYPRQRTLLRLIYLDEEHMNSYDRKVIDGWAAGFYEGDKRWGVPPDVRARIAWNRERGRRHFGHVLFIGGRRAGKGHIGAIIAAYEMYRLLLLGDPQAHFGLSRGKHLRTFVSATSYFQARDNQFADLFNLVTGGRCFRGNIATANQRFLSLFTEADRRRFREQGRRDASFEKHFASIRASAIGSNAPSGRGSACNMLIFDEFGHHIVGTRGPRTADEVYRAHVPSLDQMRGDGMVYIPTTPYTKDGRAYKLYEDALALDPGGSLAVNPDFLVIQLPSWGPYDDAFDLTATEGRVFVTVPERYDEDMIRKLRRDPDFAAVEYEAQWGPTEGGYLDEAVVDRMFQPFCPNCGRSLGDLDRCPACDVEARSLEEQDHGILTWSYRGHGDPGASGSNFAILIAHVEPFEDEEGDIAFHVVVDWSKVWRPSDYHDGQVPYNTVEREIAAYVARFKTMTVLSFDQWSSFPLLPRLRERLGSLRFHPEVVKADFNVRSNYERAERFKAAAGMGWIHAYRDIFGPDDRSLLELELKGLQLRNGKIAHSTVGIVRTKDLADCLMEVTSELLKDQLDRGLIRNRLAATRLAAGARGGYHSGTAPNPLAGWGRGREGLDAFTRDRGRRGYGNQLDPPYRHRSYSRRLP